MTSNIIKYGRHTPSCSIVKFRSETAECTCGFAEACSGGDTKHASPVRHFGVHHSNCDRYSVHHDRCNCGFVQAIANEQHNNQPTDCRGGSNVYAVPVGVQNVSYKKEVWWQF